MRRVPVEHRRGLLCLLVGLAVERTAQPLGVEVAGPLGDLDGGAVAD